MVPHKIKKKTVKIVSAEKRRNATLPLWIKIITSVYTSEKMEEDEDLLIIGNKHTQLTQGSGNKTDSLTFDS